ncbi:MAG: M15 family metallopeptidase [Desulfovibrio sp.]|nr:M15 family metallopeptidase [Desulfovibrio sp.]
MNDLPKEKAPQDELFLVCLAEVYPELKVVKTKEGIFLQIGSDNFIPYATMLRKADSPLDVAVRQSLLVPYELEPRRVPTPQGYAPGRLRSYELFSALYGREKSLVQKNLVQVKALGQSWTLHKKVAQAFLRVSQRLEQAVLKDPSLKPWLKGAGSYKWRKIAGESVLSAHAFGIALDLGVRAGATYWRWCKLRPHPLQRSYPSAIVSAFEAEGFIWGGKWHEYDLMHFEYRPELICVAKKRAKQSLPNYRHGFAPTQPKDQR